ncbi:MAG: DUF1015 domain-containing protein [Dehalococcoidia bacterium]|nr:DUF1015 domain-containing protein [Dehalococcoidia bacterium]
MVTLSPFRGWRYSPTRAPDLGAVTCPPYDVITPEQQRAYHDRDPLNIIRIEYGLPDPADTPTNNRYTRARATFEAWRDTGVLTRDDRPCLYLTEQQFAHRDQRYRRRAVIGALTLEPFASGVVLPHEETMSGPKQDRLDLLVAMEANTSPLFGLVADPDGALSRVLEQIAAAPPAAEFTDEFGEGHRLWVIDEPQAIDAIRAAVALRSVIIADGNHRYVTALTYRQQPNTPPGAAAVLMALVADSDPGVLILPTHRVIQGVDADALAGLADRAAERFAITPFVSLAEADESRVAAALARAEQPAFAVANLPTGEVSVVQPTGDWRSRLPATKGPAWQGLDVVALHELFLEPLLGVSVAREGEGRVRFTRDAPAALDAVRGGQAQLAAFLSPQTPATIRAVAEQGDRMPHKTTYFYPKMRTGLVLRTLDEPPV